jgi:hypothetical protein
MENKNAPRRNQSTGIKDRVMGMAMVRLEDGKIAERWNVEDL